MNTCESAEFFSIYDVSEVQPLRIITETFLTALDIRS